MCMLNYMGINERTNLKELIHDTGFPSSTASPSAQNLPLILLLISTAIAVF